MYAVRRMLRVAQKPFQDNLRWDDVEIELNYSLPEVFFGLIQLEGDWPVERRKAALDAYLAVMAETDFTDQNNYDRDLPFTATTQCANMNYTNALPYMRQLVLNRTLPGERRRDDSASSSNSRPSTMKLRRQLRPYLRTVWTLHGRTAENALSTPQKLLQQVIPTRSHKVSAIGLLVFS